MDLFSLQWSGENDEVSFLDVLIFRKPNRSVVHRVYRSTHTDKYLHAAAHHLLAQKQALLNTLINRAKRASDKENLSEENKYLTNAFGNNSYIQ